MKITPLDIQQQQFRKKSGRYDAAEVDSFLELVRLEFEELINENAKMKDRILQITSDLNRLKADEKILKDAIVAAQKIGEQIKKTAEEKADLIRAEAQLEGERIVQQGYKQLEKMQLDIQDLKRQRIQFETELNAVIETHAKLLDASRQNSAESDREADKLKIFSKSG